MVIEERPEAGEQQADYDASAVLIRDEATGRFVPGVSGNPYGRPRRGETYAEIAMKLAVTTKRQVVASMARSARRGNVRAAEFLRDTAEGKPATRIIVTQTDADSPLVSALQRIASRIAQAEGVTIEGEARVLQPGADSSGVSEDR